MSKRSPSMVKEKLKRNSLAMLRQLAPALKGAVPTRALFKAREAPVTPSDTGMLPPPVHTPRTRPSAYLISFIGIVLIPAFIASFYLIFLASDLYMAEARFAVRKSQLEQGRDSSKISGMLAAASGGGGNNGASAIGSMADQDAHVVADFLRTRAAIDEISRQLDVKAIFQRPEGDFWARLKRNPTIEELVDYWRGMVGTYVDGPSGVVTVTAKAFTPQDAKALVESFVTTSEALVNRLSERARQDAMRKAETEVRRTEGQVREALVALRKYRDEVGILSPEQSATATGKLLAEAMSEQIRVQNELYVASRALAATSPTVTGLKTRLEGLDAQIEKLKASLTASSGETKVLSASILRFEELEMQRIFAEKMYTLAQDSLERARLRAEQQAVYISVFVPPSLPQEARFPERYTSSILITLGLFLLWSIIALTAAAIEDHTI